MAGNVGMTIGNVIITSTCVLPLISLFLLFFFLFHVFVLPDFDFLIQSSIKWYVLEVTTSMAMVTTSMAMAGE